MSDKSKPTATQGSTDAIMPKGAADLAETGEDVNTLSENTDGDGQHRLKIKVDRARDRDQQGPA
jgi:hypothetical protein